MIRIVILLSLVFIACSNNNTVPKNILPPDKMKVVLYDIIRADEMVDFKSIMDSSYRTLVRRTSFYDTIFSLHSISKETFQNSLVFYQGRPDLLKPIFDSLQKAASDTTAPKKPGKVLEKADTLQKKNDSLQLKQPIIRK